MPRMESFDGKKKTSVKEHERKTKSGKKTTVKKHDRRLNPKMINTSKLQSMVMLIGGDSNLKSRKNLEAFAENWLKEANDKDKNAMIRVMQLDKFPYDVGDFITVNEKDDAIRKGFKLDMITSRPDSFKIVGREYPAMESYKGIEVSTVEDSPDYMGKSIEFKDGSEYLIFDDFDMAKSEAYAKLQDDIERNPSKYDRDSLMRSVDKDDLIRNLYFHVKNDRAFYDIFKDEVKPKTQEQWDSHENWSQLKANEIFGTSSGYDDLARYGIDWKEQIDGWKVANGIIGIKGVHQVLTGRKKKKSREITELKNGKFIYLIRERRK